MLREKAGVSQQKIADMVGLTQQAVGKWENDKAEPDLATVTKLADFFDCSTDYLLGKTNIRKYPHTIAAHHDGDDYTEEELADIEKFKEFVRSKREQEKEK
ncbi:MAG TPA: helix-turn-helix transcriptional regulator [Firmicutes bacterium]|nr:helix-turn-helix transcriptional regulator [Bacillota bacterium]